MVTSFCGYHGDDLTAVHCGLCAAASIYKKGQYNKCKLHSLDETKHSKKCDYNSLNSIHTQRPIYTARSLYPYAVILCQQENSMVCFSLHVS